MSRRLMKADTLCGVCADCKDTGSVGEGRRHGGGFDCRFGKEARRKAAGRLADVACGQGYEEMVEQLSGLLDRDDIIIDGGNSFYKEDIRNAKKLLVKGIHYVDCGTSGGVWGIERGYCMMIAVRRAP